MRIKEMELNEYELRDYYIKVLRNQISISDLSKTQILQIYFYAEEELNRAITNINEYLMVNPGTTFEYWTKVNKNYQDANEVLNQLSPIAKEIWKENMDSRKQLFKIQEEYANKYNWTLEEVPKNFDQITRVDYYIENLRKAIEKFESEYGSAVAIEFFENILNIQISIVEKDISNALHASNLEVNKYLLQCLNSEIKGLEIGKKILVAKNDPLPKFDSKHEKFKNVISKYGFFELDKVSKLSPEDKDQLVNLLIINKMPYCIAMFDYLGFLNHLRNEYFQSKYKLNIEVSTWFGSDKQGRSVKGNISVLSEKSKENREDYTAHLHKETVINDYKKLK